MRQALVVPHRSSRGLVATAAIAGAGLAALDGAADDAPTLHGLALLFTLILFFLVPPVILGALLAMRTSSVVVTACCGLVMFWMREEVEHAVLSATATGPAFLLTPIDVAWSVVFQGFESLAGVVITLGGYGAVHALFNIKDGDGTACWHCLYRANNPAAIVCPECGRRLDVSQCRFRWIHRIGSWIQRQRGILNTVAIFFAILAFCTHYARYTVFYP